MPTVEKHDRRHPIPASPDLFRGSGAAPHLNRSQERQRVGISDRLYNTQCAPRRIWWPALCVALLPVTAFAGPAEELSGLFLQACLPYAGRPAALRQWAAREKLPEVPDPARAAFLNGAPGQVFDASDSAGKFALLSSDDGICAVVTDRAGDLEVARALERALGDAGIRFRLVIERDDRLNPKLHHREYLAAGAQRAWRLLAATVHEFGQAMLTAAPE